MFVPERVSAGSALERAVMDAVREREAWALIMGGELVGNLLVTVEARAAALERCLATSLVLVGQRHGAVLGPLAGYVVSEPLGRAKLVELVWWGSEPFQDGILTREVTELTAVVGLRAGQLRPDLAFSTPFSG